MDLKDKIELLCLLLKAKANKPFYKANKHDLNFIIRVVKNSINSESNNNIQSKKSTRFKEFSEYLVTIAKLLAAYFNST